jgi:hypothetical protein
VIDHLRLVLGGDPGKVLALGLGDPQPLVGLLDARRDHVPRVSQGGGRLYVVVDVIEVDCPQQFAAPGWDGLGQESPVGIESVLQHPGGLVLDGRDAADGLLAEALPGFQHVVLGIGPAQPILA